MSDNKVIVISQPWGGLGDNLQYSTLPEIYTKLGHDVYISKNNKYSNSEIYDLVWKLNPYIKGESDIEPNAGSCMQHIEYDINHINNVVLSHGLTDSTYTYPLIYYKPKKIEELSNTLLYDITSISQQFSDEYIYSTFTSLFNKHTELDKKRIVFKNINNRITPDFNTNTIQVNDIFEYCDIIYSCKVFVCLHSGSSVLASAIKQDNILPEIYCCHYRSLKCFIFNNINYVFG